MLHDALSWRPLDHIGAAGGTEIREMVMQIGMLMLKIVPVLISTAFYIGFGDSSTFSMTFSVFGRVTSEGENPTSETTGLRARQNLDILAPSCVDLGFLTDASCCMTPSPGDLWTTLGQPGAPKSEQWLCRLVC